MKPIETDRLTLREWQESDRDPFARMNADPRIAEFLPTPLSRVQSDALIDRFMQHQQEHEFGVWAVIEKQSNSLIGMAGLMRAGSEYSFGPTVEIEWRIDVEHWDKGYATEAARACLDYAFDQLGLVEVVAFTVPENERSCRVMEKLGMKRDVKFDFKHPNLPKGHPLSLHVLYRISYD